VTRFDEGADPMRRGILTTLTAASALLALGAAELQLGVAEPTPRVPGAVQPRTEDRWLERPTPAGDLFWFPDEGADFRVAAQVEPDRQVAGGSVLARIAFTCAAEYYVWHDSIKLSVADGPSGLELGRVALPAPKQKPDPFAGGEAVGYLDGEFTVSAEVLIREDAPPGEHAVTFDVRYTGCGPDICRFGRDRPTARLTVLAEGEAAPVPALPVQPAPEAPPPPPAEPAVEGEFVPLSEAPPADALAGRSPLVAVLLAFVAGLGLCLTPCVYPLIPVTVALVGATSGARRLDGLVRSLVYVFGISVTYSVVGVVAAATGGMFGAWLQHPAVYLALAVLFVVLAGGMFDVYTIDLTSQRLSRLQAGVRGRAGLVGIWLVGVLSGAAATACIAPVIIAAIGYVAQRGNLLLGWLVFFAMAWGMGTPLVVVGTFTGILRALPKSGAWMEGVKRFFGLALVAAALYFVHKSRLLPQPAFLLVAGAVALAAGVFTGAFEALPPEAGWPARIKKTVGLALFALALAAFVTAVGQVARGPAPPEQGVLWLTSEQEAVEQAEAEGKPVLLDFWAEWCAPCHRMFDVTFRDPDVVEASRGFVFAKVDVEALAEGERERMAERYGVRGVPTVVIIGTDGARRAYAGYIGPERMLEILAGAG
jgi:thiol:disulfide interchange protein DsbD